jgi:hypothetical protein
MSSTGIGSRADPPTAGRFQEEGSNQGCISEARWGTPSLRHPMIGGMAEARRLGWSGSKGE